MSIVILSGGKSAESHLSINMGQKICNSLPNSVLVELKENKLPDWLDPEKHIIFICMMGQYGEDGGIQKDLEEKGFFYNGSDSKTSFICFNKQEAKKIMRTVCDNVIPEKVFNYTNKPTVDEIIKEFGEQVVIKPTNSGSSIGLNVSKNKEEIKNILDTITEGEWMIERRLIGREMTIGILNGRAQSIVEIFAPDGINNYNYKYSTEKKNMCPAELPEELTRKISKAAEKIFEACGCRDYARMDLILENDNFYFLEINSIPGMTETSLFPKSVTKHSSCDYKELLKEMIKPAFIRAKRPFD